MDKLLNAKNQGQLNSKGSVVIVGAGASGMFAAINASSNGYKVTVIEKNSKPGKKLLMTGNGKCNLTNDFFGEECFNSDNLDFAMKVVGNFDKDKTLSFFGKLGLVYKEKKGYYYPNSEQASSVVNLLRNECDIRYVHTIYDSSVTDVNKDNDSFVVKYTKEGKENKIRCDKVIIATGGKTYTKTGSDGFGYELARRFGHNIIPTIPALTGLICKEKCFKDLSGVRVTGAINICDNKNNVVNCDMGEIQLTNYGVSGIPVFQVSRHVIRRLSKGEKEIKAFIDFAPEYSKDELRSFMVTRFIMCHNRNIMQYFETFLNDKVAKTIIKSCGISLDYKIDKSDLIVIDKLCDKIKKFDLTIVGHNDYENAQVTAGGVDTREINPDTMESKIVKGLYFAGEIVDVDGICGGYNLQWAWSSGYLAGSLK